jgi:hypothetical protein
MIDLSTETILSLKDAVRELPALDGKKPHLSTVWRWMSDGVQGRVLEHVRVGRRICTSREALYRFLQQPPSESRTPSTVRTRTAKQREADVEAARARLAARGVVLDGPGAA